MPNYNPRSGYNRLNMFPSVIKWLMGINLAVFILGMIPAAYLGYQSSVGRHVLDYAALWPIASPRFAVWQYITYMFLHGGFSHIFFNMLTLWMFGMELAQMWGSRRFLAYYFLCGLGAGIIHTIVTALMGDAYPTVGASGAIMGVMVAFGLTFPDRVIFVGFFLPMKAKFAVFLFAGIDLYMGLVGSPDGVAHFAHLGGALVGFILLKIGGNLTLGGIFDKIPGFGHKQSLGFMKGSANPAARPPMVDARFRDMESSRSRNAPHHIDLSDERLNAVLDKMLRQKLRYQDLTEEERMILDDASNRMRGGPIR
jgi:membrane associated rhomboid family serine protease